MCPSVTLCRVYAELNTRTVRAATKEGNFKCQWFPIFFSSSSSSFDGSSRLHFVDYLIEFEFFPLRWRITLTLIFGYICREKWPQRKKDKIIHWRDFNDKSITIQWFVYVYFLLSWSSSSSSYYVPLLWNQHVIDTFYDYNSKVKRTPNMEYSREFFGPVCTSKLRITISLAKFRFHPNETCK